MKKIQARDHKKCYTLSLLPKAVAANQNTYFIERRETKGYYHIMIRFLRQLGIERQELTRLFARMKTLDNTGGLLLSYEVHHLPTPVFHEEDWVQLDLNYMAEKYVRLEIGNNDVTSALLKDYSLQKMFNDILCGVYAAYDELLNINQLDEPFIEELFLQDDVEMSVNEKSEFVINVDSSLRDFLLDLNQKLQ